MGWFRGTIQVAKWVWGTSEDVAHISVTAVKASATLVKASASLVKAGVTIAEAAAMEFENESNKNAIRKLKEIKEKRLAMRQELIDEGSDPDEILKRK